MVVEQMGSNCHKTSLTGCMFGAGVSLTCHSSWEWKLKKQQQQMLPTTADSADAVPSHPPRVWGRTPLHAHPESGVS